MRRTFYTLIHPKAGRRKAAGSDMAPACRSDGLDVPPEIDEEFQRWTTPSTCPTMKRVRGDPRPALSGRDGDPHDHPVRVRDPKVSGERRLGGPTGHLAGDAPGYGRTCARAGSPVSGQDGSALERVSPCARAGSTSDALIARIAALGVLRRVRRGWTLSELNRLDPDTGRARRRAACAATRCVSRECPLGRPGGALGHLGGARTTYRVRLTSGSPSRPDTPARGSPRHLHSGHVDGVVPGVELLVDLRWHVHPSDLQGGRHVLPAAFAVYRPSDGSGCRSPPILHAS